MYARAEMDVYYYLDLVACCYCPPYCIIQQDVMSYQSQQCMLITELSRSICDPFFLHYSRFLLVLSKNEGSINSSTARCPSLKIMHECVPREI